jgi:hypothetical protein
MLKSIVMCTACATVLAASGVASAADVLGWEDFVIRNSNTGNVAPVITDVAGDAKLFQVNLGGQKAAWGTNLLNNQTVGDIATLSITRDRSVTGWGPYINIWITDGNGHFAALANEPSDLGDWPAGSAYNMTWDILKNARAKVNETAGLPFALPTGKTTFTFADFANYTIATPTSQWGSTGAADDLNAPTYTAYGINWVFGDTQSNYVGGYLVSNPSVTSSAVPLPAAAFAGLSLLGSIGAFAKLRRKTAQH